MNKYLTFPTSAAILSVLFLITACSSGGDDGGDIEGTSGITFSGNTSPAAIDATNIEAVGKAAGESVQIANASTGLPLAISISSNSSIDINEINNIVISTFNIFMLPAGPEVLGICDSGSVTSPTTEASLPSSGPVTITFTFINCKIGTITFNGTSIISLTDIALLFDAPFTINYINFAVTEPTNGTTTINMTVDCTSLLNCTYNSDFIGSDGVTHRVTGFSSISGDAINGFNGSATFFHGTFGQVTIIISNITYGSCGSFPNGGAININSTNGSSGTIIFNGDCTVSGSWDDGNGSAGTF